MKALTVVAVRRATRRSVKFVRKLPQRIKLAVVMVGFAIVGAVILSLSYAATPAVSLQPENGALSAGATVTADTTASGGQAIRFPATVDSTISPVRLMNGDRVVIGGETFTAQSPDKSYSMMVDPDPAPTYTRCELRSGDQWINDIQQYTDNRERCEFRGKTLWPLEADIWMSGALRITASSWKSGGYNDIIQFFQAPPSGEAGGMNPITYDFMDGKMHINTRGDTSATTTSRPPNVSRFSRDWGPYLGKWAHFVMRARFSKATANGQLDVWLDGTKVTSVTGIVMGFNNPEGPYAKMGVYRSGWTAPIVSEWANYEVGRTDLSARITRPLPTPN